MISRTSTEAYRNTAKSIAQIGTELNVEIRPQRPYARVMLIKSQLMNGDAAGAVRSCDEVQAITSVNVELVVGCGIALQRAGDARAFEIMTALRAANKLPPNLAFDPLFEPLRTDERYAKLLR